MKPSVLILAATLATVVDETASAAGPLTRSYNVNISEMSVRLRTLTFLSGYKNWNCIDEELIRYHKISEYLVGRVCRFRIQHADGQFDDNFDIVVRTRSSTPARNFCKCAFLKKYIDIKKDDL